MRYLLIVAAACCVWFHPVHAATEAARPAYTPPPPAAITTGSVMQILFSLVLVLAAVAVVAWMMKRINMPQHGAASLLKVISGVGVGPRERVVLVEVNDTWLIIGVAPGQVRTLHTMPKGVIPQGMRASADGADNKFQHWLKQVMEKHHAAK